MGEARIETTRNVDPVAASETTEPARGADARREAERSQAVGCKATPKDPFIRAENEDDDGHDPYSDRRPAAEPLFERDPWA